MATAQTKRTQTKRTQTRNPRSGHTQAGHTQTGHASTGPAAPSVDAAFERATELGDQFASTARKAGNLYLDSYEKAVDRAIEIELKLAGATQQEWLRNLIEAQADFARELTSTYTSSARSLLK